MHRKIVFHIISHLDVGGAERVAINIAESPTEGISYHVVELIRAHSDFTDVLIKELRDHNITYHRGWIPEIHFHYLFERLAALTFPLWFLWLFLKYKPQVCTVIPRCPTCQSIVFFVCFHGH